MAKKKKIIADANEVRAFLTTVLRDEEADFKDRLKVSEYLLKTGVSEDDAVPAAVTVHVVEDGENT